MIKDVGVSGTWQFALFSVSNTFQNDPPVITSNPDVEMLEDSGYLDVVLLASDPDGDNVTYRLGDAAIDSSKGNVSLDANGRLKFHPCRDCFGTIYIPFIVTEVRIDGNPSLSTPGTLHIHIKPINDNPQIIIVTRDGITRGETTSIGQEIGFTMEQQRDTNATYEGETFFIGGFDVDIDDILSFFKQRPNNGSIEIFNISFIGFLHDQNCSLPWSIRSSEWEKLRLSIANGSKHVVMPKPCLDSLPHSVNEMAWAFMMLVYKPDYFMYGKDALQVLAEDRSGALSDTLTVSFFVMENRCENGAKCVGPPNDTECTHPRRSQGFDGYGCACMTGFTGTYCEYDIDDCEGITCPTNETCVDGLNNYTCHCYESWPCHARFNKEGPKPYDLTPLVAILGIVFGLVIIGLLVTVLSFTRQLKRVSPSENNEEREDESPVVTTQHDSRVHKKTFLVNRINPAFDGSDVETTIDKPGGPRLPFANVPLAIPRASLKTSRIQEPAPDYDV